MEFNYQRNHTVRIKLRPVATTGQKKTSFKMANTPLNEMTETDYDDEDNLEETLLLLM